MIRISLLFLGFAFIVCIASLSSFQQFLSFNQLMTTTDTRIVCNRFWHLKIPTVGLHHHDVPFYPYIPHFFSLWQLCPKKGMGVNAAILDTGVAAFKVRSLHAHAHLKHPFTSTRLNIVSQDLLPTIENNNHYASHGSHCYGIINAQEQEVPIGLAPAASLFMIKVCDNDGTSDIRRLIKGLKKALELKCCVVNMSVALSEPINYDDKQTKKLITLLKKIPYIIAPSGNQAMRSIDMPFIVNTIAYPAAFPWITFDVGAFSYESTTNTYPVCPFSQFHRGKGPKILAPGFNIVSTGIPTASCNDPYLFLHGTSMAAAIMTGFVTLMLAEFGNELSRQQLLKVCYTSCIRLHDTQEWNERCILGTLDMRTALFVLHVLQYLKKNVNIDYAFESHFDNMLKAINWLLQYPVEQFSKKYLGMTNFRGNFADFYIKAQKISGVLDYIPKTVADAVKYIGEIIIKCLSKQCDGQKMHFFITHGDYEKLAKLLYEKVDLFDWLKSEERQRIIEAVNG